MSDMRGGRVFRAQVFAFSAAVFAFSRADFGFFQRVFAFLPDLCYCKGALCNSRSFNAAGGGGPTHNRRWRSKKSFTTTLKTNLIMQIYALTDTNHPAGGERLVHVAATQKTLSQARQRHLQAARGGAPTALAQHLRQKIRDLRAGDIEVTELEAYDTLEEADRRFSDCTTRLSN